MSGNVLYLALTSLKPSWTALYPSLPSAVLTWVITFGSTSTTVTGTIVPFSLYTRVMPTFLPSSAGVMSVADRGAGSKRRIRLVSVLLHPSRGRFEPRVFPVRQIHDRDP